MTLPPTTTVTEQAPTNLELHIRTAHLDDAAQIAELAAQLGYPVTANDMRSRLEIVVGDGDHLVIVAENHDNKIIGWLHLTITRPLLAEPASNIAGLVVDEHCRRHGVGRALMREAEAWTLARRVKWVSLRSNIMRTDAHKFYEQLGYQRVKTQHACRKRVAP
jgi:GNAT superfamily N-acetyltransferase